MTLEAVPVQARTPPVPSAYFEAHLQLWAGSCQDLLKAQFIVTPFHQHDTQTGDIECRAPRVESTMPFLPPGHATGRNEGRKGEREGPSGNLKLFIKYSFTHVPSPSKAGKKLSKWDLKKM